MTTEHYNLLPLDTWRRLLGFNPWHFWGLYASVGNARVTSECNDIVTEYAWQDVDSAGRAEIREAIIQAELLVHRYAGFWPAPRYDSATEPWPRLGDARLHRIGPIGADWRRLGVVLSGAAYLQAIGTESRAAIGTATTAGGTLVYSDADSDGLLDTFTITLPVPGGMSDLTTDQVAVYFAAADRVDSAPLGERWRVAPVQVTLSGGNATVRGRRWLVVRPGRYEGMDGEGLDASDAANFVTSLEVYRRTTDPNGETLDRSQAVLEWETRPCHGWWCCCTGCTTATSPASSERDPAAVARAIARAGIRDAEIGIVLPAAALRDATTGIWSEAGSGCWEPDRVIVRYLAGWPLANGQMAPDWAMAVARLAAAELARPICACDSSNKELYRWQFDLATAGDASEQYQVDPGDLANPLGTRRGHLAAWKKLTEYEVTRGFIPG